MDIEETFEAECISKKKDLTEGKIYQVKQSKYTNMYELIDDTGHVDTYFKERFKIIETPGEKIQEFHKNNKTWFQEAMEQTSKAIITAIQNGAFKINVEGGKMEDKTIKVRCIGDVLDFKKGEIYIAVKPKSEGYLITDDLGEENMYYESDFKGLFEKVEDVLMVECVENKKYIYDNITTGKKYRVLEEEEKTYKIINNDDEEAYYMKDCFKPVEPQKEIKEYSVMELLDFPVDTIFKYDDGKVKIIEYEKGNKGTEIIGISRGIELSTNWTKTKFTLIEEPKPVNTAEAFKALDEGKIIESVISKDKYKKINGIIHIEKEDGNTGKLMCMYRNELEGQWIIIEGDK